jgi:hypothetical protein
VHEHLETNEVNDEFLTKLCFSSSDESNNKSKLKLIKLRSSLDSNFSYASMRFSHFLIADKTLLINIFYKEAMGAAVYYQKSARIIFHFFVVYALFHSRQNLKNFLYALKYSFLMFFYFKFRIPFSFKIPRIHKPSRKLD